MVMKMVDWAEIGEMWKEEIEKSWKEMQEKIEAMENSGMSKRELYENAPFVTRVIYEVKIRPKYPRVAEFTLIGSDTQEYNGWHDHVRYYDINDNIEFIPPNDKWSEEFRGYHREVEKYEDEKEKTLMMGGDTTKLSDGKEIERWLVDSSLIEKSIENIKKKNLTPLTRLLMTMANLSQQYEREKYHDNRAYMDYDREEYRIKCIIDEHPLYRDDLQLRPEESELCDTISKLLNLLNSK
ncbi:MAG: hypothetical protein DRP10_00780 [Candidatus Aenigmatarchaeota archaeon]|nr:MAG: hypothetical protein DRP10_00780 [Candidatus Aenigmarchaeota archaeon]